MKLKAARSAHYLTSQAPGAFSMIQARWLETLVATPG